MTKFEAQKILERWLTAPQDALEKAVDLLVDLKGQDWLNNAEFLIHPRDTIDERSLGVHQRWNCNLMPYRQVRYGHFVLYLFEHHIEDLLQ